MSYALQLRREAKQVLHELPISVQDDLWELFDKIALEPHAPDRPAGGVSHDVHEFVYSAGTRAIHVYFNLVVDDDRRIVFIPLIEYVVEQ